MEVRYRARLWPFFPAAAVPVRAIESFAPRGNRSFGARVWGTRLWSNEADVNKHVRLLTQGPRLRFAVERLAVRYSNILGLDNLCT